MSLFKYIASEAGASPKEFLIEADSEREAREKLRVRGIVPIRSCGEADSAQSKFGLKRRKINTFEFTRELSPLLDSYIPLERALGIIAESSVEKDQKDFVNAMRQSLHEGKKFSEIVRSHGTLFPPYYANLIESGEETGCMPQVTSELYKFMGESKELRDFIVSSSVYPLAILCITLIVTILLFTVFVPRFANIFSDMGREQPPSMQFLLAVSAFAKYAWWLIPLLLYTGYQGLKRYWGEEGLKFRLAAMAIKVPLFGRIFIDLEMCKYVRTLSILIANHVEIIRTVRIAGKIIANPVISQAFQSLDRKLKGGEKLSAAFAGNPFIPPGMTPMLRVGEESGNVGPMLEKIAVNLENDTRQKIKRLLSLFEPAVIVFLAVIVLIVVVSIFVAMMEINAISQGGPNL